MALKVKAADLGSARGSGDGRTTRTLYLIALPLLLTCAAYAGSLRFQFVYDDFSQVLHNPSLHSWRNLPGFFVQDVWSFNRVSGPSTNYYRPLFLVWLLVNYKCFGLHAWAWHLTTVLAHVSVTALVYAFAAKLTRDPFTASLSACIFGMHPVHVEAVAWVSGASESLVALPFIASLLFYGAARKLEHRSDAIRARFYHTISVGLALIALFTKETAIVLPAAVFAYETALRVRDDNTAATRFRQSVRRAGLRAAPFLMAAAVYLGARVAVLKGIARSIFPLRTATIVFTLPSVLWFYVKLLIWPIGLSAFYDTPYVTRPAFAQFALPLIYCVLFAGALLTAVNRLFTDEMRRNLVFCAVFMVLPIVPLLNLSIFTQGEIAHDRYLYIPAAGFCVIVASLLRRLGGSLRGGLALTQAAICLLVLTGLAVGTVKTSSQWSDDLSLYSHAVSVAPRNRFAANNLAVEFSKRGEYDRSILLYDKWLKMEPENWMTLSNIGYCCLRMGNLPAADSYLSRATKLAGNSPAPFLSMGLVRQAEGRLDEAASYIREAIAIKPNGDGLHEALGNVLSQQGDLTGALREFRTETQLNPDRPSAWEQLRQVEASLSGLQNGATAR